jgi:hypothetical protein
VKSSCSRPSLSALGLLHRRVSNPDNSVWLLASVCIAQLTKSARNSFRLASRYLGSGGRSAREDDVGRLRRLFGMHRGGGLRPSDYWWAAPPRQSECHHKSFKSRIARCVRERLERRTFSCTSEILAIRRPQRRTQNTYALQLSDL